MFKRKFYREIRRLRSYIKSRYFGKNLFGGIFGLASLIIAAVFISNTFTFAYDVKVDDNVIATVSNQSDYYQVLSDIKQEVSEVSEVEFEPKGEVVLQRTVAVKNDCVRQEELKEKVKATSSDMVDGFSVISNNACVVSLLDESDAQMLLDSYKKSFEEEGRDISVTFNDDVSVVAQLVPSDSIKSYDEALDYLVKGRFESYTFAESDTLAAFAKLHETDKNKIIADNGLKEDEITAGTVLKIYKNQLYISIKTVERVIENIEIPYITKEVSDPDLYVGKREIKTKGENGIKYVDKYITKVDGTETETIIAEEQLLKGAVAEVVHVGTNEVPPSVGTGEFAVPASGSLSSTFGSRWGKQHSGIDIAAATGTPIYASDTGVVTYSQFNDGGYGYLIKLDHKNGKQTYYAHCSMLLADVGDVVQKGDLIALVGNTGNSYGAHLHFEVRDNDVPKNPLNYISLK